MDWHDRSTQLLDQLTAKEREVLDLVLQHKPTKEIARELGLAPNTVDMRLRSAREKLGTSDRKATARAYTGLLAACGKTTCGPEVVVSFTPPPVAEAQVRRDEATFVFQDAGWIDRPAPWDLKGQATPFPVPDPKALVDSLGAWARVALVFGTTAFLAVTVLAIFAIADTLSRLDLPSFLTT